MGNRICRARRSTVEDRYTKPQRLVVQPSNVDYKKLRKLILSEKLAPCFDGVDDCDSNSDLEECPICFFFYPSLNRSNCCAKGICTECFLQMKPSNDARPAQCPFCKTSSYAVEYRGARTQEEKGQEQAEEQKVIEAKTRMLLQESQNMDQIVSVNQNSSPLEVPSPMSGSGDLSNGGVHEVRDLDLTLVGSGIEFAGSPALNAWNERHAEFGLDLEEIMLVEAIWQSIQGTSLRKSTEHQSSGSNGTIRSESETYMSYQHVPSLASSGHQEFPSLNSVTGGVAIAIARMAERNILHAGTFHSNRDNDQPSQTQDENSIEHQSRMLSSIPHGANMVEGPIGYAEDTEFDEASLENDCLASSSTSEDDSWDSLSACILEANQSSEDEFISDEDLVLDEAIDMASSCSSSVHTISDLSCGSLSCSDIYGGLCFSQVADLSS